MLADVRHEGKLARQETFLQVLAETGSINKAIKAVGITRATYENHWRKDREFAAKATQLRIGARDKDLPWDGTFADFRKRFFSFDTPWFHQRAVDILENAKKGSVTLLLWPPGHGKSTLLVDWCCYKLALNPGFRITVGAASAAHSRKMLRRVKNRMEADSPTPEFVARWGPFAPQSSTDRKSRQPWGADFFDVHKKSRFDEQDYSMVGWGYGGKIIGSRTDLIIIDDVQDTESLGQTDKIFEVLTQDWLSRMIGSDTNVHCVIIGSRVGDDDIYQRLMDEGAVDDVVMFRAHHPADLWPVPEGFDAKEKRSPKNLPPEGTRFLWPERYDRQDYLNMRVNAKERGWARNFMQAPVASSEATFTPDMVEAVANPLRRIGDPPPAGVKQVIVSIDPGFGVNATMACGMGDKLTPLAWRTDRGLTNNTQIFSILEEYLIAFNTGEVRVTDVIIEDKAFQKGLLEDETLKALQKRYGFRVTGHQTGATKNDPDIGIPGMDRLFFQHEIELPGADDPRTVLARRALDGELVSWRPYRKGTQLRQDLVMTLYFAWLRWRQLRSHLENRGKPIQMRGMAWKPTKAPLASKHLRAAS